MKLELAMQPGFNFAKKNRFHGKKKFAIFQVGLSPIFFSRKKISISRNFFFTIFSSRSFRDFVFAIFFLLFFQVALSAIFFPVENSFIRSLD